MNKLKNFIAFALVLFIGLFTTNLAFGQGAGYQRFFQKISGENAVKTVSDYTIGSAYDRVDIFAETLDAVTVNISGSIGQGPLTISGSNPSIIYGDGTKSTFGGAIGTPEFIDIDEISTPANPDADIGRFYVKDDGGTTKLYFRDSAGTETDLVSSAGTTFVGLSDTPSNFTASGGKLVAVNSGGTALEFIENNVGLATSDYDQFGSTDLGSVTFASLGTSQYNDIPLNAAGLAAIVKYGISKLGIRASGDRLDSEPTWVAGDKSSVNNYSADRGGTSEDPKLVVNHSEAAGASGGSGLTRLSPNF